MRVAIEVTRLRLGGRQCQSALDPLTHHRRCNSLRSAAGSESAPAFLQLRERPWGRAQAGQDVLLQRDCLCDTGLLPFRSKVGCSFGLGAVSRFWRAFAYLILPECI